MARKKLLEQDEEDDDDDDDEEIEENDEDIEKHDNNSFVSDEQINYDVKFKCMPSCNATKEKWCGNGRS